VSGAYQGCFERFIAEQRLPDLFVLNASAESDFLGYPADMLARHVGPAIVLADILVEIDHVLRVVGAPGAPSASTQSGDARRSAGRRAESAAR